MADMNSLVIPLAILCVGCVDKTAEIDRTMERAMKVGGCVKVVCSLPLKSLHDCGPGVGSCR